MKYYTIRLQHDGLHGGTTVFTTTVHADHPDTAKTLAKKNWYDQFGMEVRWNSCVIKGIQNEFELPSVPE